MALISILGLLVVLITPLLVMGLWINPALMFIGLYIHSYVATATATDEGGAHGGCASDGFTSLLYKLFGIPGHAVSGWDLLFHALLKIPVFWITVSMAVCILWSY